jgi:hypothetical protein
MDAPWRARASSSTLLESLTERLAEGRSAGEAMVAAASGP